MKYTTLRPRSAYHVLENIAELDDSDDNDELTAENSSFVFERTRSSLRWVLGLSILALIIVIIIIVVIVTSKSGHNKNKEPDHHKEHMKASEYSKAVVATDHPACSKVGADILRKKGNAMDSAVASAFCLGVLQVASCGIGGGGFMVFYNRSAKTFHAYDFRETAPASATEDMFVNDTTKSLYHGLAIAVPGEIKGLYTAHKNHGKLLWSEVVKPAYTLATQGFTLEGHMLRYLEKIKNKPSSPGFKSLFQNKNGSWKGLGDKIVNKEFAETLTTVMNDPMSFYEGDLAKKVAKDVQDAGGIITVDDLKNYKVETRQVLQTQLEHQDQLTLSVMGPPSSGAVLSMISNIVGGYNLSSIDEKDENSMVEYYHRLIEAMKFSYAQRGQLGDPDFLNKTEIDQVVSLMTDPLVAEKIRKNKIWMNQTHANVSYYGGYWGKNDFGTSHLSVVSKDGDAVSSTHTINYIFGSLVRSNVTGLIYNNEMDDFSTPGQSNVYGYAPTKYNFIRPGKRPLSSMTPSIITDVIGDVKMVLGASGGSKIITGVAQVMLRKLYLNEPLGKAVDSFRIHHQGIPDFIQTLKKPAPPYLVEGLKKLGHKFKKAHGYNVVQAIYKDGDTLYAASDPRKGGLPDGI